LDLLERESLLLLGLEIVKKNPSRLLVKLVTGDPVTEIKSMLGVYEITTERDWLKNVNGDKIWTTVPVFIKRNTNHRFLFCSFGGCWQFQRNFKTILRWAKGIHFFNEEFWSNEKGSVELNASNFTLRITAF